MKRLGAWFLVGNLFLLFFAFFLLLLSYWIFTGRNEGGTFFSDVIGVIEIKDTILDSEETLDQVDRAYKNDQIKAVLLRIDSPGGAVGASQEIYQAILHLKEKKKVVASLGNVAASGGYYIAVAADKIVANPGTITGSIGVLMDYVYVEKLLDFFKIHAEIIKAGNLKDVGSPLRPMKPEERQFLENLLQDMHRQFKEAVAKGRSIPIQTLNPIADGRIFTGEQALKLKLVDQLGGQQDAVEVLKKLAGIKGEPELVYPREKEKGWLHYLIAGDAENHLLKWFFALQEKRVMFLMR